MFNRNKLRGKMAENCLTADKLAEILNISPTTFWRKTTGESEFTRSEIQKISVTLHLSMQEVQDIFFAQRLA